MTARLSVGLEIKALSEREFEGHGSIFKNVDLGGDIVLPGAFKRTLAAHRKAGTLPAMFWMHKADHVPGAWLDLREDENGLYVRGQLAETQLGNEMRTLLDMKAVRGLSIGYRATDVDFDDDGNRLLKAVDLWEVSIVSLAMNPLARVENMKAARLTELGEYVPTEREFEQRLRDAGCSRKVARQIVARIGSDDELPPRGMLDGSARWDAEHVEGENDETALLKSLENLTSKMVRAALQR